MRARIIAIIILIILIGIPVGAYYYLTNKEVASLYLSGSTGSIFSVELIGSLGFDGLPLADRVLSYRQDCTTECLIRPILPARYTLVLTSSGKIDITETISIDSGEQLSRSYQFIDDVIFTRIDLVDSSRISSGSTWHIRTETGSFVSDGQKETEDIRFTDAIDLTSDIRLGYIDQSDTAKLSISNFAQGQSVLIRLDRTTGESSIVRRGLDIGAFFFYNSTPAYMGREGDIYTIDF